MKQSERKAETKRRLLDAASKAFKSQGFSGVGVDGISKAADATSGAFYAHLGSKNGAFLDVLERGLDEVIEAIPQYQADHGDDWPTAFADYYLGMPHVRDAECGCAMAALSQDVGRGDPAVKSLYGTKMAAIAALIAGQVPRKCSDAEALERSWAYLGTLIGGVTLARSMTSQAQIARITAGSKAAAVGLFTD